MDGIQCAVCCKSICRHERVKKKHPPHRCIHPHFEFNNIIGNTETYCFGCTMVEYVSQDKFCLSMFLFLFFYDCTIEDRKNPLKPNRFTIRSPMRILIFVVVPYTSEIKIFSSVTTRHLTSVCPEDGKITLGCGIWDTISYLWFGSWAGSRTDVPYSL